MPSGRCSFAWAAETVPAGPWLLLHQLASIDGSRDLYSILRLIKGQRPLRFLAEIEWWLTFSLVGEPSVAALIDGANYSRDDLYGS